MTSTINQRRAALQLTLFLAAFFVLWTLRATVFLRVLPAAAYARWLRNAPPAKYLGLSTAPGRRVWKVCLGVTFGFLLAVVLVELVIGRTTLSAARLSSLPSVLGLLQFVLTPLLEEILFRGLVMKECLTLLPVHAASALTSLLFVGAHLPYWLSHGGPTPAMMTNVLGVFLFSLVACWLYARSASIWPSTLAHIANNILSSLLVVSRG